MALAFALPEWIAKDRIYDTTFELLTETRKEKLDIQWDIQALEKTFLSGLKKGGLEISKVKATNLSAQVTFHQEDPRETSPNGFALAHLPEVPSAKKREWTPKIEEENRKAESFRRKNDRQAKTLLIPSRRMVDGVSQVVYYGLPFNSMDRKQSPALLFVSLDSVTQVPGVEQTYLLSTHAQLVVPEQRIIAWEARRNDRCNIEAGICGDFALEGNAGNQGQQQMAEAVIYALGEDFALSALEKLKLGGAFIAQ